MKTIMTFVLGIAATAALMGQTPEFTKDNQLVQPANYREWVFLSSGLGMTYGAVADANRGAEPSFDNVFVNAAAYKAFLHTGKWPEHTVFVLETPNGLSERSIHKGGH